MPGQAAPGSATAVLKKMTDEAEEARELAEMRRGGFLGGGGDAAAAGKAAAAANLEATPGARRIRRTIVTTSPDGERSSREVVYTDRDKVGACMLVSSYSTSDAAG